MEINTEMNRVFGTEIAKLFASTISEEELQQTADKIWNNLNLNTDHWGSRKVPEIERLIREKIVERLYTKIEAILAEPVNDELLEKKAREMVEKARQAGEEIIIRDMAANYAENILSVHGRRESIIQSVLAEMNIMSENRRN